MQVNKQWLEDHGLTQEDIDEFRHPGPEIIGGDDHGDSGVGRTAPLPDPFNVFNQRIRSGIDAFSSQLGQINPQFFDIGQGLIDRGLGTGVDPLVEAQRGRAQDALRARSVRSGVTGGVFENQQARLNAGFDQSNLGRKDQALQGGVQLQQSALQNLLAPPTLETAALTANKSGGGGGGGKK